MQDVYDFFCDGDLIVRGVYPLAVDTHGARNQWMCVFVYVVDHATEPAVDRAPMTFTEVYLGQVEVDDFRRNARGELGTRTATLNASGTLKLRGSWIYLAEPALAVSTRKAARRGKASQPNLK